MFSDGLTVMRMFCFNDQESDTDQEDPLYYCAWKIKCLRSGGIIVHAPRQQEASLSCLFCSLVKTANNRQ